ncbi:MAG TPA: RNA polymerase sigma factor [Candidatus Acidoferrales bacterium]
MAPTDVQLMLGVKEGDETAFELLLARYRSPVINFLYRMLQNRAIAEELAQEVFFRVYRARKDYKPTAKFTTWMFRIASNLALNAIRDGRAAKALEVAADETDEQSDLPVTQVADCRPTVEQDMMERDRARAIRQAVGALPEKQRTAVFLHKYQDMEYTEIAKIIGCSESALKSLLFRAYETLRERLKPLVEPPCGRDEAGFPVHPDKAGGAR